MPAAIKNQPYLEIQFVPRLGFLHDCKGGRFENFTIDLGKVSESLGLKNITVSHENKTRDGSESCQITYFGQARKIVYTEDIAAFSYECD